MKNCGYEKWIHRFVDGELDRKDEDEFQKHLFSCDNCKERVFDLKSVKELLSCAKEDLSLPELKYRVMQKIEQAENSSMRLRFQLAFLYGRVAPALAAAAMLFIAVSVWNVGKFHSETDSATAFLEEREIQAPEFEPDIL